MIPAAFPHRISIIGAPGAGKTTLSRRIAEERPAPIINADQHFWEAGWTICQPPNAAFRAALRAKRRWIADGSVLHAPSELLERSDLVIYLDYPAPILMVRNLRRWLRHRKWQRAELPPGCPEPFPLRTLAYLMRGDYRRAHERALAAYPPRRLVRVRAPRQLPMLLARALAAAAE
jgi:adenylate kinase family enzyme